MQLLIADGSPIAPVGTNRDFHDDVPQKRIPGDSPCSEKAVNCLICLNTIPAMPVIVGEIVARVAAVKFGRAAATRIAIAKLST
jgi:hypothetical protein